MQSLTYIYDVQGKTPASKKSLTFTKYRYRDYKAMPLPGVNGPIFMMNCESHQTRGHEPRLLNSGSKI